MGCLICKSKNLNSISLIIPLITVKNGGIMISKQIPQGAGEQTL
jgi:hypothetical protein